MLEQLVSFGTTTTGVLFVGVSVLYSLILRRSGIILLPAFLFTAAYSFAYWQIFTLDLLFSGVWSATLLIILRRQKVGNLSKAYWALFWSIPVFCFFAAYYSAIAGFDRAQPLVYLCLVASVASLLITEQIIRATQSVTRVVAVCLACHFFFGLYFYSDAAVTGNLSKGLFQARSLASFVIAVTLITLPIWMNTTEYHRRKLQLSRPLIVSTSSIFFAGVFLVSISTMGYFLSLEAGYLRETIRPLFAFLGILFVGLIFSSDTRRGKIRVWISKHFFQTKYDLYYEWRTLSEELATANDEKKVYDVITRACIASFSGTGAILFLRDGNNFRVKANFNHNGYQTEFGLAEHDAFLDKLGKKWIFIPAATNPIMARGNETLPKQPAFPNTTLFILPLLANEELIGFLSVSASLQQLENFSFEDFDLLRMIGSHISSQLANLKMNNELVVTRQFEAFHQFTTFVMHDLKNLIAQQALVVENAKRFSHNPEFVADAMHTIENSVKRMNRLMLRINRNSDYKLEENKPSYIQLIEVVQAALLKCSEQLPTPQIDCEEDGIVVFATFDSLVMAFTHLISNAQEACTERQKIDILICKASDLAICTITDTGSGMDSEFINHRLFTPFDSTKKNQGMGIGAFQAQRTLNSIGGRLDVKSILGEGSCFTLTFPSASSPTNDSRVRSVTP